MFILWFSGWERQKIWSENVWHQASFYYMALLAPEYISRTYETFIVSKECFMAWRCVCSLSSLPPCERFRMCFKTAVKVKSFLNCETFYIAMKWKMQISSLPLNHGALSLLNECKVCGAKFYENCIKVCLSGKPPFMYSPSSNNCTFTSNKINFPMGMAATLNELFCRSVDVDNWKMLLIKNACHIRRKISGPKI